MSENKHLTIIADLHESAKVRDAASDFLTEVGFDKKWVRRLVLVVDELFMNAVKYGCRPGDMVEIVLSFDGNKFEFDITDMGRAGISPEQLHELIEHHGDTHCPQKTSGRGLAIITHAWTDGYAINKNTTGGLTVSFFKTLTNS